MANFKQQTKDTRTPEEIAIQSAMHSHYNIMMPMRDAEYVRIHHPITTMDVHVSTKDPKFFSTLKNPRKVSCVRMSLIPFAPCCVNMLSLITIESSCA